MCPGNRTSICHQTLISITLKATLEPLVSKRNISYLNPKAELSQFQRSRSFIDGLEQASEIWKSKYKITARGMRRAYWIDDDKLKNVCTSQTEYHSMALIKHHHLTFVLMS